VIILFSFPKLSKLSGRAPYFTHSAKHVGGYIPFLVLHGSSWLPQLRALLLRCIHGAHIFSAAPAYESKIEFLELPNGGGVVYLSGDTTEDPCGSIGLQIVKNGSKALTPWSSAWFCNNDGNGQLGYLRFGLEIVRIHTSLISNPGSTYLAPLEGTA